MNNVFFVFLLKEPWGNGESGYGKWTLLDLSCVRALNSTIQGLNQPHTPFFCLNRCTAQSRVSAQLSSCGNLGKTGLLEKLIHNPKKATMSATTALMNRLMKGAPFIAGGGVLLGLGYGVSESLYNGQSPIQHAQQKNHTALATRLFLDGTKGVAKCGHRIRCPVHLREHRRGKCCFFFTKRSSSSYPT